MNRRGFLSTLGAALAAPLIPALPSAAPVAVNRYTYGLAALHTRIESALPLSELAKRFSLTAAQSRALAGQLVADGLVTQQGGTLHATRPLTTRAAKAATVRRAKAKAQTPAQSTQDPMMAYLHGLCERCGIAITTGAPA